VRILRAIKFATRLAFRIDEGTWMAMCEAADDLSRAATPRVLEEILRLLRSGTALGSFRMLRACGALRVILPQVDDFLGPREGADDATHERADTFWRLLEALDNDVHAGFEPSTSLALAVLFLRVVEHEAHVDARTSSELPGEFATVADDVMDPLVRPARVSRRAVARSRRIMANQARFVQTSSKTFRPLLFMHQEDFEESLQLFRLRSAAWGQGWDLYEAWVARYEEAKDLPPEELAALRKKRRRRRRRRKPGRRGGADS
jgi:poly(A) polymerase